MLLAAALLSAVACATAGGAGVEVVAEARFPEGPLWHRGRLYYVEYGGHTVVTWDGETAQQLWRQEGCGPSALVPTTGGDLLVACYDANAVVRVSAEGETLGSYTRSDAGEPLVGPNDFAADAGGGIYLTASGPWESAGIVGKIFYLAPDGAIRLVADDLHYPNGIALSPDGKTLYCAESEAFRVVRMAVAEDGSLSDRRLFVRLGELVPDGGPARLPDGLEVDSRGRVYIAQFSAGQILVVDAAGQLERTIAVPSPSVPNLALGPAEEFLYLTAVDDVAEAPWPGKVYRVRNRAPRRP
jgi:sugar lactone lactonase YvrE